MLGGCSLTYNGSLIDGKLVRSKRIWMLLEYLITYRFRCVAQEELYDLLYSEDKSRAPSGALKTLIHRAREALERCGIADGRELVIRCAGGYRWNPDVPLEIDTVRFEELVREASVLEKNKDEQLKLRRAALDLYKGDFLPQAAADIWAMSTTTYFHYQYLTVVNEVMAALVERERFSDVVCVAGKAIAIDPYDESLYLNLILALANTNRPQAARAAYESMSKLFYDEFGVAPSKEMQALYKKLVKSDNGFEKDLNIVSADLCKQEVESGAFFCEYEFFRDIFRLWRSSATREGGSMHICLISTDGKNGKPLQNKVQNTVMQRLRDCIRRNLREGDVFSRYSVSQFIVLLPISGRENSEKVIERIVRCFRRDNSHSPAALTYSLQTIAAAERLNI